MLLEEFSREPRSRGKTASGTRGFGDEMTLSHPSGGRGAWVSSPASKCSLTVVLTQLDYERSPLIQSMHPSGKRLNDLGDVVVRTTHRIEPLGEGRVRVVYRMDITGPKADALGPEIGPQISSDFPEVRNEAGWSLVPKGGGQSDG